MNICIFSCREIQPCEGVDFANSIGFCEFAETSAAESYHHVEKVFRCLFRLVRTCVQINNGANNNQHKAHGRKKSLSQVANMIIQNYRKNQAHLGARSLSLERMPQNNGNNCVENNQMNSPELINKKLRKTSLISPPNMNGKTRKLNNKCMSLGTLNEEPPRLSIRPLNLHHTNSAPQWSQRANSESPPNPRFSQSTEDSMSLSDFSINEEDAAINAHEILRTVSGNNRLSTSSFEDELSSYHNHSHQINNQSNQIINQSNQINNQSNQINKNNLKIILSVQSDGDITDHRSSVSKDSPVPTSAPAMAPENRNQFRFFGTDSEYSDEVLLSTKIPLKHTESSGSDGKRSPTQYLKKPKLQSSSSSGSSSLKDEDFDELPNQPATPPIELLPIDDKPIMFRTSSTLPSSFRGGCDFTGFEEKPKRLSLKSAVTEIIKMRKRSNNNINNNNFHLKHAMT